MYRLRLAYVSEHEAAWIAAHRQAWIAAASEVLTEYAPTVTYIADLERLRAGTADRDVVKRLAARVARGFRLYGRVKRAVDRLARAEHRAPTAEKADAVIVGVVEAIAAMDERCREMPWALAWSWWLPKEAYRHAQQDLLQQAKPYDREIVPGLDDTTPATPIDEELVEQWFARSRRPFTMRERELLSRLAARLPFEEAQAVMQISTGTRWAM